MPLQLDPSIITSTDLLTLHDQHTLSERHIVPGLLPEQYSTYAIPASGIVLLRELPERQQTALPTGVVVTQVPGGPFTEVLSLPGPMQFQVNYNNGSITFNVADAGKNISANYTALGSVVLAEHVNNITKPLAPFYNKLNGIVSDGGTDFTFPNDVTISGDLNVIGVVNRLASEVIELDDSIILINRVQDGPSFTTAGIEVSRGGAVQGSSTNPQLVWSEPSLSWNFFSTVAGPTSTLGYPLLTVYDKGGVKGTNLTTAQETTLVGTLGVGDAGLQWFNTTDSQFKGWTGSQIVILG